MSNITTFEMFDPSRRDSKETSDEHVTSGLPPRTYTHQKGENFIFEVPSINLFGKFEKVKNKIEAATKEWLSNHPAIANVVNKILSLISHFFSVFKENKKAKDDLKYFQNLQSKNKVPSQELSHQILLLMNQTSSGLEKKHYKDHEEILKYALSSFHDVNELEELQSKYPGVLLLDKAIKNRKEEIQNPKIQNRPENLKTLMSSNQRVCPPNLKTDLEKIETKYELPTKENPHYHQRLAVATQYLTNQYDEAKKLTEELGGKVQKLEDSVTRADTELKKSKEDEVNAKKEERLEVINANDLQIKSFANDNEKLSVKIRDLYKEINSLKESQKTTSKEILVKNTLSELDELSLKINNKYAEIEEIKKNIDENEKHIQVLKDKKPSLSQSLREVDENYQYSESIVTKGLLLNKEIKVRDETIKKWAQSKERFEELQKDLRILHHLHGDYSNLPIKDKDIENVRNIVRLYLENPSLFNKSGKDEKKEIFEILQDLGYDKKIESLMNSTIASANRKR